MIRIRLLDTEVRISNGLLSFPELGSGDPRIQSIRNSYEFLIADLLRGSDPFPDLTDAGLLVDYYTPDSEFISTADEIEAAAPHSVEGRVY